MDIQNCKIIENKQIAACTYKMVLECRTENIKKAGQFINIMLNDFYLRRPISICDFDSKSITIIYKTLGEGTQYMTTLSTGTMLNCMIALGNGFDVSVGGKKAVIVGGGVGVPPLYGLAKELITLGIIPTILLGFNTDKEIFLADEFRNLGCEVVIATVDGSFGHKGFVTALLDAIDYDYFYACGPLAMLKALHKIAKTSGQLSLEERMGCGFGACMGCSIMTTAGAKRVCKEGPVFLREELIW